MNSSITATQEKILRASAQTAELRALATLEMGDTRHSNALT